MHGPQIVKFKNHTLQQNTF